MLALSTISSYKDDHLPEMEGLGAPGPQTLPLVKITNLKTNKTQTLFVGPSCFPLATTIPSG